MTKEAFKEMNVEMASTQNQKGPLGENNSVGTPEVTLEEEENIDIMSIEVVTEEIINKVQGENMEAVIGESSNKKIEKKRMEIRAKSMMIMMVITRRQNGFKNKEIRNKTKLITMTMLTNHIKNYILNIMMKAKKSFIIPINIIIKRKIMPIINKKLIPKRHLTHRMKDTRKVEATRDQIENAT